jgi:hypothetical protein
MCLAIGSGHDLSRVITPRTWAKPFAIWGSIGCLSSIAPSWASAHGFLSGPSSPSSPMNAAGWMAARSDTTHGKRVGWRARSPIDRRPTPPHQAHALRPVRTAIDHPTHMRETFFCLDAMIACPLLLINQQYHDKPGPQLEKAYRKSSHFYIIAHPSPHKDWRPYLPPRASKILFHLV